MLFFVSPKKEWVLPGLFFPIPDKVLVFPHARDSQNLHGEGEKVCWEAPNLPWEGVIVCRERPNVPRDEQFPLPESV